MLQIRYFYLHTSFLPSLLYQVIHLGTRRLTKFLILHITLNIFVHLFHMPLPSRTGTHKTFPRVLRDHSRTHFQLIRINHATPKHTLSPHIHPLHGRMLI